MKSKVLDYDELTGIETIHHYDEVTGKTYIEYIQDVQTVVDRNKELAKTDYQKHGAKNEFMHAATIPPVVELQWRQKYGIKDIYSEEYWPKIKRLLNNEYKYLKVGDYKL